MTVFDYAVLVLIGVSILLSVMRGFLREVMALLSWVVAFWVANLYTVQFAPMLPASIPTPELRLLAAFVALFLATLLVMTLISITVGHFLKAIGIGPIDRALGAVFGFTRGMVIVLVLVMLAGLTNLPKAPMWKNAMFSSPLEMLVMQFKPWLPAELAKRLNYSQG